MNGRGQLLTVVRALSAQIELKQMTSQKLMGRIFRIDDAKLTDEQKERATKVRTDREKALQVIIDQAKSFEPPREQQELVQSLLDPKVDTAYPVPEDMKESKAFNHTVYQELYPILMLAHAYEKNGTVEEHAKKLACMFASKQDALQYLAKYAEKFPDKTQFVHDSCLFTVPLDSPNQSHWIKLANIDKANNLLDSSFVRILNLAKDIDGQMKQDLEDKCLAPVIAKYHGEAKAIEEVNKQIQLREKFCKKFGSGFIEGGRNEENTKTNILYSKELKQLYDDRAVLHLRKPFSEYTVDNMRDLYRRLIAKNPDRITFLDSGIDQASYLRFKKLDRSNAGKNIPDVSMLDCGNGFYIKKINAQDDKEASIAACLGKLTDCCQSISGEEGEPCAVHGLTHEDSGFYVLFKKESKDPNPSEDIVYGQTWVNRTAPGRFLFDSIESKQAKDKESKEMLPVVAAAFRHLANYLVEEKGATRVQCGATSGISKEVGIADQYQFHVDTIRDYKGHHDSKEQLFLADPRLFLKLDASGLILDEKKCAAELEKCKQLNSVTDAMRFNIGWAITNQNEALLKPLLASDMLKDSIEVNRDYFNKLMRYGKDKKKPLGSLQLAKIDNTIFAEGKSMLHLAASHGHVDLVQQCLEAKFDPNKPTYKGVLPLFSAIKNNHSDVVKLLIAAHADVHLLNMTEGTPLSLPEEETTLHAAVKVGAPDILEQLVRAGAKIDSQNDYGITPLMLAARRYGGEDCMKVLLDAHADPNVLDVDGSSALYHAVVNLRYFAVTSLIAYGANVNQKDKKLKPLLHIASEFSSANSITQALVKAGVDLNARDALGNTALICAALKGNDEAIFIMIQTKTVDVNAQNIYGSSVLMHAINRPNVVEVLIESKVNCNLQDQNSQTALMQLVSMNDPSDLFRRSFNYSSYEAKEGRMENEKVIDSAMDLIASMPTDHGKVVDMLIEAKTNLDIRDIDGDTALILALRRGNAGFVDAYKLISAGADPNVKNNDGQTAMDMAKMSEMDSNLIAYLEKQIQNKQAEKPLEFKSGSSS